MFAWPTFCSMLQNIHTKRIFSFICHIQLIVHVVYVGLCGTLNHNYANKKAENKLKYINFGHKMPKLLEPTKIVVKCTMGLKSVSVFTETIRRKSIKHSRE